MKTILRAIAALWLCHVTAAPLTAQTGETSYHPEVKSVVLPIKPHPATAPRVPWCPPEVMAKHPRPQMPVHKPNYHLPKKQDDAIARQKQGPFNPYSQEPTFKTSTAVDPVIGASFRGNEGKFITSPPDNAIAISDDGYIVSATNETVEYYDEQGNRLQLINSLYDFVGDTNATLFFFDPKVLYDPYFGRFIFSVAEGSNAAVSRIHLLFSRSGDPRDGWTNYTLAADTLQEGFWADRPELAISEGELFVTANMISDTSSSVFRNKVWQIQKKEPMASLPNLIMKIWPDLTSIGGDTVFGLVPLSDGLGMATEPGIWLVSTKHQGGNVVNFFHIEDSLGGTNLQVTTIQKSTSQYSRPAEALQFGTQVKLGTSDCRVQSGFFLDSIIHYAFNGDIGGGYSGIIYNRFDIRTLNHHRDTWGSQGQFYYAYPAIATFGTSKTDRSVMVAFLRSGVNLYPQVCVVNYDGNNWSPNGSLIVKNGESYASIFPMDTVERWGDYSGICRKFNSPTRSIWLAGQYGVAANMWGNGHGYNTWIAEVLDTAGTAIVEPVFHSSVHSWEVFPNPAADHLSVLISMKEIASISLTVQNLAGSIQFTNREEVVWPGENLLGLDIESLPNGVYLILLNFNSQTIGYEKLIIAH